MDSTDEPAPFADIDVRLTPGVQPNLKPDWLAARLHDAANLLAQRDGVRIARVAVLVVNDARMSDLHQRHSGVAGTTDVLTFDLRDNPSLPIEADIVVCADEAARRSAELGHAVERELLLYCVHGLLHCAGHDDHDDAAWRRMHAREDEILAAIGVGATFHSPSTGRDDPYGGRT